MIPQPGAAPSPRGSPGARPGHRLAGPWGGYTLRAPPAPLDRNHGSPSLSASPAPDPLLEIEHLGLRAEPEAKEKLWRQRSAV
jgi:hypothetical protein